MAKIKIYDRELYYDTTDDDIYELRPDGTYQKTHIGGAALVIDQKGTGSIFNADKSVTNASQVEAIPAGAKSVTVKNISGTATDIMRFRFGTDNSVTATTNTGFYLLAGEQSPPIPIMDGQTWWAWIGNNAVAFSASVVWGL